MIRVRAIYIIKLCSQTKASNIKQHEWNENTFYEFTKPNDKAATQLEQSKND